MLDVSCFLAAFPVVLRRKLQFKTKDCLSAEKTFFSSQLMDSCNTNSRADMTSSTYGASESKNCDVFTNRRVYGYMSTRTQSRVGRKVQGSRAYKQ
jgi:hypothetical protein